MVTGSKKGTGSGEPTGPLLALVAAAAWLVLSTLAAGWIASGGGTPVGGWAAAALDVWRLGPAHAFTPSPAAWLCWVLTALIWAAPLLGGLYLWARVTPRTGGGAQWGGAKVEKLMAVSEKPADHPHQLTLGYGLHTKKLLAGRPHLSAVVFGLPGSAKTTGLIQPNALEWPGPVVVTVTKAADLDVIYKARAHGGRPVWVIAPNGIPGRTTHHWSPVAYCTTPEAADKMAEWLADAAVTGDDSRSAPWVEQAKTIVKAVLLAAHHADGADRGGIETFTRWLKLGPEAAPHVTAVLRGRGFNDAAEDYEAAWQLHPDGIGSIRFTLNVITRVYSDTQVRATSPRSDFTAEELLQRSGTLCMVALPTNAERLAPLFTALSASILNAVEENFERTGKALDPPLAGLWDEAGNMLRYPKIGAVVTNGRALGVVLLTVWHDLSQMRSRIGREAAATVVNASSLRVLLPGQGDLDTLSYFNRLLDKTQVDRVTTSRAADGSVSTSTSTVSEDLAPVHALRELDDGTGLAQDGNRRPVKFRLRMAYEDKALLQLSASGGPAPLSLDKG